MSKGIVIWDLDGTLIAPAKEESKEKFVLDHVELIFRHGMYYMTRLIPYYHLAIWSAGSASYVEAIAQHLEKEIRIRTQNPSFSFLFVWSRKRCTQRYDHEYAQFKIIKNLKKVDRRFRKRLQLRRNQIWIVDDAPSTYSLNRKRALPIETWNGDVKDKKLYATIDHLINKAK